MSKDVFVFEAFKGSVPRLTINYVGRLLSLGYDRIIIESI